MTSKRFHTLPFLCLLAFLTAGCGHLAYLGMHGKSIQTFPDIHESVIADSDCLECHADGEQGPETPHPGFTGCLKCHND